MTNNGYDRPEIGELRDDINALFIQYFGEGIDLDDDQTPGLLAGVLSEVSDTIEQVGQGVYNAFFVLKSSGANLDDIGAEEGLYRKSASNSNVTLQIDADPNTVIPEGTQFSTDDAQIFETTDDLTIGEATTYVDTGGIVQPLQDDDGNPLGRGTVQAISQDTGDDMNVMPNTIINSEEALDGFNSVTNLDGAQGGGNAETDDQYRIRILENRKHPINSTVSGIETALMNVNGVQDVRIVNNIEMTPDEYGNPAKSIHVYVIGGDAGDIAQALFDVLPPVTRTIGSVAAMAKDIAGKIVPIMFDRATTVPIYIEVDIKADPSTFDSDNGEQMIKNNIMNYFDTLSMGDAVLYSRLFAPAYSASGVKDVTIKLGTKSPVNDPDEISVSPTIEGAQISVTLSPNSGTLLTKDIQVSDFQLAQTSVNNIAINVTYD